MEHSKLMTPLFYDGNFNREGRRMRAVLEKEISDGTQTYGGPLGTRIRVIPAPAMIGTSFMWRSTAILPPLG